MCESMVDIQCAAAEIRRGKKEDKKKKNLHGKNITSASATEGGHKNKYMLIILYVSVKSLLTLLFFN